MASQEDSQEIVDAAKKKRESLTTVQMEELSLTEGRQNHVDKMQELMEATDVQVNLTAKTILNRQMPRIPACGESFKELDDWVKCTFAASAERQADAFKSASKAEMLIKKGKDLERRFDGCPN